MSNAFAVVEQFEASVAEFAGAPYAVAVNTGTSALFLSLMYARIKRPQIEAVVMPARTFISVPMAAIHAGFRVAFDDHAWYGVYTISPTMVVDSALRFKRGMYKGGLQCLSFHARKLLNIGEGGAVLTDDADAAEWLRSARYSGRSAANGYRIEAINMLGWQAYMTPEKAARGLHLMEYIGDGGEQTMEYSDLRECPVFRGQRVPA